MAFASSFPGIYTMHKAKATDMICSVDGTFRETCLHFESVRLLKNNFLSEYIRQYANI